jgi:hypothetical protein
VSTCTSLNELDNALYSVFPNPSNGQVSVKNITIGSNLELINILGEVVFKDKMISDSKSFDFTKYAAGSYYLKLTTPEGKSTVKKLQFN